MNKSELQPAATFSMIVTQIVGQICRDRGISMAEFHEKTGISQPSWSRLSRGQTRFDIEDLKIIERQLGIPMSTVVTNAMKVEQKARSEGIKIIPPYTTQNKDNLAKFGLTIVAAAVLAFLASQALKK